MLAMSQTRCGERAQLESNVVASVRAVYGADAAEKAKARIAERDAVRALESHIKEHGCG